jgi:AAA+ ATPase superfamily predicted ATPase/Holliday junction resolvase
MYFSTAKPVIGEAFHNRNEELGQLLAMVESLKQGVARYYALLGLRKVGKSSLIVELKRRTADIKDVVIAVIDCYESCVDANTFFEDLATKVIDEFLITSGHATKTGLLSGAKQEEVALIMTVGRIQTLGISALNRGLLAFLEVRRNGGSLRDQYRAIIDLPETLASETNIKFVVVFDEFQECAKLNSFKNIKTTIGDVFKFFRANWQRHTNVAYLISGSEITLLEKIIQAESSPFFQHFNSMPVREFSFSDAFEMFSQLLAKSDYSMSDELLRKLIELTNGHPFYLQILGEELCKTSPQKDIPEDIYKTVIQETLFESAGRLYLYFASQYQKHIKTSTSLEKTLVSISSGHHKVSEIAKDMGQLTGLVSSFLSRLVEMDILMKVNEGYQFRDPVFGLWIAGTKSHLKSVISPYTLGDFVEKAIADKLSKEGFSLVYQSKASRGTFDLLAILNSFMVGLQVKKTTKFPFYLPKDEALNMLSWGERLNWLPVLCVYIDDANIRFFSMDALSEREKSFRADEENGRERLLELVMSVSKKESDSQTP